MLVTADGKVHIAYIGIWETVAGAPQNSAYGRLHHKYSGDGATTWTADDPPLRYTHDPTLATDPQGNLYVFGHREVLESSYLRRYARQRAAFWRGMEPVESAGQRLLRLAVSR